MRFPGGKFRLWVGDEVNRPDVPTPIGLSLSVVVCIVWLFGMLVFVIGRQLGGAAPMPAAEAFLWAVFGGLVPILIAYRIVTNHHSSRWLISMGALGITLACAARFDVWNRSLQEQLPLAGSATFALVLLFWWLFISPRMRAYFALVADKPLPADLDPRIELVSREQRLLAGRLAAAAPYLEVLGVLLILFAVGYAFVRIASVR